MLAVVFLYPAGKIIGLSDISRFIALVFQYVDSKHNYWPRDDPPAGGEVLRGSRKIYFNVLRHSLVNLGCLPRDEEHSDEFCVAAGLGFEPR